LSSSILKVTICSFFIVLLIISNIFLINNTVATAQINSDSQSTKSSFSSPIYHLPPNSMGYWWFNDIKQNDPISIYIGVVNSSTTWTSTLNYSNGTQFQFISGPEAHNHSFNAPENGNYLLTIATVGALNYFINSSVPPSPGTPFNVSKVITRNSVDHWWVNNVKAGTTLIVGIDANTTDTWYSSLHFSNGTQIQFTSNFGAHSHIYLAPIDDNYIIVIQSQNDARFNYIIKCSSQIIPAFGLQNVTGWYWTGNTQVNSVASGDVDGDGQIEIVSAGFFNDGTRNVAQLIEWNQADMSVDRLIAWYWTGDTVINSVALGDVDGDGQTEIVTGGYFNDGNRKVAQLIEWNGANLAVERLKYWYLTGNTVINSVAIGDVDNDGQIEVTTGGYYNDGARNVAQLIVWNGTDLSVDRFVPWFWTSNTVINSIAVGDVDGDGQVEIVSGGYYNDGVRSNAQLIEWNGATLAVDRLIGWYWTGNTAINSIALGDVDGDGQVEVVSGGFYTDGALRSNAQLIEWNGANLSVDRLTGWCWTNNTEVNSVALGDVDADGLVEIVTAGQFNDESRDVAQLVIWSGPSLGADKIQSWYWNSNTRINSVAVADINQDLLNEIVAGGSFYDGTRLNSQLTMWGMS
jgi:hypothetical protein